MNYRRFFTVDSLISLNIQNDNVFHEYHKLIKELCDKNIFNGLRIDHIDGLYDPKKILTDLRQLVGEEKYSSRKKYWSPEKIFLMAGQYRGNSGYDFRDG